MKDLEIAKLYDLFCDPTKINPVLFESALLRLCKNAYDNGFNDGFVDGEEQVEQDFQATPNKRLKNHE